jgi:adenylate kinase family enzyme
MCRVQFYAIAGRLSQEYAKMPQTKERTTDHIRKDLHRVTKDTAELIDHYIEKYARFDGNGEPSLSLADVDRFQSLGKDRKDVQSETTDTTSIDKQASPS